MPIGRRVKELIAVHLSITQPGHGIGKTLREYLRDQLKTSRQSAFYTRRILHYNSANLPR
jgi:hypothetical protein